MKIYVPLPEEKYIDFYLENDINGFFLGIKNYSINFNNYLSNAKLKTIIEKIKNKNKEIYVSFNKLYYSHEIPKLKEILLNLSKLNIDGIIFSDTAIYNIIKDNKINIKLIWDSYHLGTNYQTVNFWYKRNVKSAILSNEITIDEILQINNNTNSEIGVTLYGYLNMVTSSRSLLSNYFEFTKKDKKSNNYLVNINDENYPIIETNKETNIFSSKVLNGIEYFPKLIENNVGFIILNDYLIDHNKFYNVIEAFCALRRCPNDKEFVEKLKKVVDVNTKVETYEGFLNKETIYKVKNNE